jgi:hypothetical protein
LVAISEVDTLPVTIMLNPAAQVLPTMVTKDSAAVHCSSPGLRAFEERRKSWWDYFITSAELRKNELDDDERGSPVARHRNHVLQQRDQAGGRGERREARTACLASHLSPLATVQSNAAPTIIFLISSHGEPCEMEFVCVGWPFASPPVPNF